MRRSWPFLGCWVCLLLPGHLIAQTVPGTITTIAGTGEGGYTGDSGPATLAKLSLPSGVAVDPKGNIYVADTSNRRIRRIGFDGTIATIAEGWVTGANGDTRMNVYLAIGNRIRQVEADGSLTTIANEDGQGSGLRAAAMDAQGNVYVAEEESHRIRRVGPDGRHTTFAGTGEAGYSGDGGSAAQAKLNGPRGVAVDAQGNVYIADTENGRIRRVGPDGAIVTFVGLETGAGPSAGPVVLSRLNRPMAVAVDAAGNLYIADTGNHRIRRVGVDGLISAWAGTGAVGYAGDGGAADQAWLSRPEGIAVDAQGNTYIADTGNHRIRRVSAAAPSAAQPPPALPPDTVSPPPATTPIPPPPPPGGTPTPTPPGSTVSSLDFDGDGTVGFSDYFLFADGFGKEAVGGRQDLNGNGIVDGEDLLRFADGFGQPAVSTPLPSVVDGPNQGTKAVISQERGNWNVTLSGATAVNGAAVRLTYDSTRVQVGDLGSTTRPQGWVLASWTRRDTLEIATAYLNSVTPSAGLAGDFLLMSIPMSGDTSAARVVDITLRGSQPGERNRIGTASIQYSSPVPAPGPAGTPIISLWPLSLSFGDMQTGRQQPLNLPIGNTGNAPLVVSSITVTGPSAGEFAVSPTAFSVNSGAAAQTVTVTFSPSSVGAKSAALSITHNAAGSPISVSLSGTGASAPTSQVAPGTITTTAGTGDPGFTGDGGLATQARLNWPQGVAVDAQGNVYVCDSINNRVRRVGASGVIATFAGSGPTGSGQGGFSGNGGPATQAGISNPTGVAVDAQGYVYIAEGGHVRRVGPDGTITAFVDIPAVGIAIDAQGNTYTADGSRIRHLSPDGVVTTIAGMGRPDFLGDGGPATQAGFMNAFGVAVDAQGNVYIVDSGRNRVRRGACQGL